MLTEEEKAALVDEHIPSRAQFAHEDNLYKLVDAVQEAVLDRTCKIDVSGHKYCQNCGEEYWCELGNFEINKDAVRCRFCGRKIEVVDKAFWEE